VERHVTEELLVLGLRDRADVDDLEGLPRERLLPAFAGGDVGHEIVAALHVRGPPERGEGGELLRLHRARADALLLELGGDPDRVVLRQILEEDPPALAYGHAGLGQGGTEGRLDDRAELARVDLDVLLEHEG